MNTGIQPFYINDLDQLRAKLARAERDQTRMGQVWSSVRRRAQAAPGDFPWFTPFVALVTGAESDVAAARQAIRDYVGTFATIPFSMGLQFHFWCFAFPHCRWATSFQWLDSVGAWETAEAERLREQLVEFAFLNFFSGLRTKPEPECVDNQTMALCLCNALVGELFPGSAVAARLRADGVRRLPAMLGGMPPSGYSGEGSTYMDCVVGPAVPFVVELLERIHGGDWFNRPLEPTGCLAANIVRMISREWTPSGLVLPWDHYGWGLPVRSCIAYGAHRTGDPFYHTLLEEHADWGFENETGWGCDEMVWSLIWWPEQRGTPRRSQFPSWAAADVGAALVAEDSQLYLMQMWDPSTPHEPGRAHVNPNALVLCAYGSPLTVDGVKRHGAPLFEFADTWQERRNMDFKVRRDNYGSGCAGAHGVLLMDGWEGMRAKSEYPQGSLVEFDETGKSVTGDVTPLYREHWPDTRVVQRRSRLCHDRFWLVEDLASFADEHTVTARFYFRPQPVPVARGVGIETAEGVRLHWLPLVGPAEFTVQELDGYPDRLDGRSVQVNFTQRGRECRWLWLGWPEQTRVEWVDVSAAWEVRAETGAPQTLPFTAPPFVLADLPLAGRWWYRKTLRAPVNSPWWLRLPRQPFAARLWVNGAEIDLEPYRLRMALLAPHVAMPVQSTDQPVEVAVGYDCSVSQSDKARSCGAGFWGRPAIFVPAQGQLLEAARYADGIVHVRGAGHDWQVPHPLMEIR